MKRVFIVLGGLLTVIMGSAQPSQDAKDDSWKKVYRGSAAKINDLENTRLDVKFD